MVAPPVVQAAASIIAGTPVTIVCNDFSRIDASAAVGADGTLLEFVLPDPAGGFVPTIHLPQSTCSTLRHLDRKRPGTSRVSDTFRPGGSVMLAAEGSALEVLAHGATHIRLESSDESEVECSNFNHRRATIAAFERVGVRFSRKVVGELLLGMRWQHLNLWPQYRDRC